MRKWVVAILALALLLLGTMLPLVVPRHCPFNRAACERIKEGMTRAQVEEILTVPAGDYRTGPVEPYVWVPRGGWSMVRGTHAAWAGNDAELDVCFEAGVAVLVDFTPESPAAAGPLELAIWRLERLKERLLP
jgi:hypothetical protein